MKVTTRQLVLFLLGLGGLVIFFWLVVVLQPLLTSLIIAALLAYLLNPLVSWLMGKLKWQRPLTVTAVFVGALLTVMLLIGSIGAIIWERSPLIITELTEISFVVEEWLKEPFVILGYELLPTALITNFRSAANNALSSLTIGSDGLVSSLTDNLLWTLVILVSFFYLLRDGHLLREMPLLLFSEKHHPKIRDLINDLDEIWGIFLRMQLFIFAVLSLLVVISTTLILWLFRQGLLPLSPIGLVVLLIIVYTAIQQVDNLWLRPQLMGQAFQLHSGVLLVSLLAALALGGVLTALLIVPTLASLKVLVRFCYQTFVWESTEEESLV